MLLLYSTDHGKHIFFTPILQLQKKRPPSSGQNLTFYIEYILFLGQCILFDIAWPSTNGFSFY